MNQYQFDKNGSPTSGFRYDYKHQDFSEKKKAQIQREKALLDDNMKDLTYMQLLTGSKQPLNQNQQNFSPKRNYLNNESSNKSPFSNQKKSAYEDQIGKKYADELSMEELKTNNQKSIEKQRKIDSYSLFQKENDKVLPSPIQRNADLSQLENRGLTPKASKHYDGVRNLYKQELDVLKNNIFQCQLQESKLIPSYNQKEEQLWQSFSRTPSPNKYRVDESQVINEVDAKNQPYQENSYFDQSPQRIKEASRPENVLKNEIYMMMLKGPQQQNLQASGNTFHESSGILTYSKGQELLSCASQFPGLKSSLAERSGNGITPFYASKYKDQWENEIEERQIQSKTSKFPPEDEIERIRKENEQIVNNLSSMMESKQQNQGVSFSSKEKNSVHYYDKNSPSITSNPYQRNLYNSAKRNQRDGSNILTDENIIMSDNSNNNIHAHNLTLSPMDMQSRQNYNPRNQHYADLVNADEQQLQQMSLMMKDEEEQDMYLRQMQEEQMNSPYRRLNYLEQMKKYREDRQKEEQEMQVTEQKRMEFQRNVLRVKQNQKQKSLGNLNSYRKPEFNDSQRLHLQSSSHSKRKNSEYDPQKYLTPTKRMNSTFRSQRSHQTYMDVPTFTQGMNQDKEIDYKNYLRRVSKYDIDRGIVDFSRLKKEKEKDRTNNVRIKKEEFEKNQETRKYLEVEATNRKLNDLQAVKEKQEKDRKEFVRKQQEQFRKAIEERQQYDKNSQYLSPGIQSKMKSHRSGSKAPQQKSQIITPVKANHDILKQNTNHKNNGWSNEIQISGNRQNQDYNLPFNNNYRREVQ